MWAGGSSGAKSGCSQAVQSAWKQAAAYPGRPTWFSAAFTIGDKAFLGTGYDFEHAFLQLDAGRESWTRKADFPGEPRGAAVGFAAGGKGYFGIAYVSPDQKYLFFGLGGDIYWVGAEFVEQFRAKPWTPTGS